MCERPYDPLDECLAVSVGCLIPIFALVAGSMYFLPDAISELSQSVGASSDEGFYIPFVVCGSVGILGGTVGSLWYRATHQK